MKTFLVSLRMFFVLTIFTGLVYPLIVWGIGNMFFPGEIEGSLIKKDGNVVGSSLIAQNFLSDTHFTPRPSASEFGTLPSGASNFSPTSLAFKGVVEKRKKIFGDKAPDDLLTSSGSGVDPHLSPEAVRFQIDRIVLARHFDAAKRKKLEALVESMIEGPHFGFLGSPRINVLSLNLEMNRLFAQPN